ncbi:MAG: glycoside hydrolase family 16 protein [Cytophagales bacterium]|jgi:beta-glucanase (GH16 family)|nr:glycoside hydrolase family 16 protein [Cytophagales bacterium]
MRKKWYYFGLVGLLLLPACNEEQPAAPDTATPPAEFSELVWSDDFNGNTLDPSRWSAAEGAFANGNGEQQYFRPENVSVRDGNLVIRTVRETYGGQPYTSGTASSKGRFSFQENTRIDIRMKMTRGAGLWNSLTFLPVEEKFGPYPKSGAMTLEHMGVASSTAVFNAAYDGGVGKSKVVNLSGDRRFADDFHVFTLIWEKDMVRWFFEDQELVRVTPASLNGKTYPFNEQFFLNFGTKVGGSIAGPVAASTTFPQELLIDYVRVYRNPAPRAGG